jgi:hypothetical protein
VARHDSPDADAFGRCPAAAVRYDYGRKLAVTVFSAVIVTVQVLPETESQPLQPVKRARKPACAVRVTTVP